jgi:cyclopropane fatty-acyl-phospholipid synthase-like methyltransferase
MKPSSYYDLSRVEESVRQGQHRDVIGGLWDEIGDHQMQFLLQQGMKPNHRLLDIGCGSLRLGARAIAWLDHDRYFGTDISKALIDAGRERELTDQLRAKAPLENFSVSDDFDFDFLPAPVDFAIAQSVFTHLPINHLRRCLAKVAPHVRVGGSLFVTYFECAPDQDLYAPLLHTPGAITTYDFKDPYHYRIADLVWAVDQAPWAFEPIGDWSHPRDQRIARFRRL